MPPSSTLVSALIVCQNEQALIAKCLESVSFCAEIVVIDSGSTDGTIEIIERYQQRGYPIRLMHHAWSGYGPQKQFALDQASMPWSLIVDADERIDDDLRTSIMSIVADDRSPINGWRLRRRDWLAGYGQAHRHVVHNRILRLFRSGKVKIDPETPIHETFLVEGPTSLISRGLLLHMRNLSIEDDLARASTYARQKATNKLRQGVKPSVIHLCLTPPYTFIKFYLLKRYFLCGRAGFIYSMMMMIYSFLTEAKLHRISSQDATR